jgi:hypothetical protein
MSPRSGCAFSGARAVKARSWAAMAAAAAIPVVLGLGSGAAYAFWSSGGSGTGSASVGKVSPVVVAEATGTVSTPLFPGASGEVVLGVANPNPYPVTLVGVVGNGPITPDSAHTAGCTTTGVTFSNQTTLDIAIPADQADYPVDLSGAASMSASSSTGCQGATFEIPVAITVQT